MQQLELPFPRTPRGPVPHRIRLSIVNRMQDLRQKIADAAKELERLQYILQSHQ